MTRFNLRTRGRCGAGVLLAAALLALAACGSSDNPPAAASTSVPASAGDSTAAFLSFQQGLTATDNDTGEPLTVDGFTPPTDETSEPQAL